MKIKLADAAIMLIAGGVCGFSIADDVLDLPEITVSDTRDEKPVVYQIGGSAVQPRYFSDYDMMNDLSYHAFLNSLTRAASVCNAQVSYEAKQVTAESDVVFRWMAAEEVYGWLMARNILQNIIQARGGASIMINNNRYLLFDVTYSDGAMESWGIVPGALYSSVKLLDQPVAGSLRYPRPGYVRGCRAKG